MGLMTTIKSSCPICGDKDLQPALMTLNIYENALERSYYCFTCTTCHDIVAKPADAEVIALLLGALSAGLNVNRVHIPGEALETHVGWVITHDDILDFSLSLRDLEPSMMLEELRPSA